MTPTITKETMQFLKELKANNDKEWFNKNKDRYIAANDNFVNFIQGLIGEISKFDKNLAGMEAKKCVFRIYRDTRFGKDKSPYKTNFGALLMGREKFDGVGGYYLHLEPGGSFLAGGLHMTESANLKAIREEVSSNGKTFLKVINDKSFKENLEIKGDKLQKVPQGFDKEDPMGEYLKYKEMMLFHKVADKQVLDPGYTKYCAGIYKLMVPFNKFITEPLQG